jgi:hypothetical protein
VRGAQPAERAERVRSGASKEIEMVCKLTPLLAGAWERRGDWDRGDKLVGMCVVIGGDVCVCVCVCDERSVCEAERAKR